jgi:hypothetical protein
MVPERRARVGSAERQLLPPRVVNQEVSMTRIPVSLPLAAAAAIALGACASPEPNNRVSASMPTTAAKAAEQALPYRPGTGTVQSVSRAPAPISSAAYATNTATAGASAPETWYRLGVRMEDGGMQYIDTNSTQFPVGARIQLTEDRLIRQP